MKKNRLVFGTLAFFAVALIAVSCGDPIMPSPDFDYAIDDKTVTFTNTSMDATSYSWDFDDESTAVTTENATHTYASYGDYDVRLTATNDEGEEIKKTTISVVREWPTIAIDGAFTDWADVEALYTGYGTASGALTEIKMTSDAAASKLYFYVKGDLTNPVMSVWINADGDTATGWQMHGWLGNGAEYQFEYEMGEWCALYTYGADQDQDWPWETEITDETNGAITMESDIIGDAEIEFAIESSLMVAPAMSNEMIGVFFNIMDTEWEAVGTLPPEYADPLEIVKLFSFQ